MSKKVEKKRPFIIDSQPILNSSEKSSNSSDSETNDNNQHTSKRKKLSHTPNSSTSRTLTPSPSISEHYSSEESSCLSTDNGSSDEGNIFKQSLNNSKFVDEIFSKICGPGNVTFISDILKEWIQTPYGDDFYFTYIPKNILNEFIYVDQWKNELFLDLKLQKKFIHHVIHILLNQAKEKYVDDFSSNLHFQSKCFRNGASKFNSKNLNLFSTVTKKNMPNSELLRRMFGNKIPHPEYITPKNVDKYRLYFLAHYQMYKHKNCDCCIQMYIREDLKKHNDESFKRIFPQLYKLEGLSKTYTEFKNYREFLNYSRQ